MPGPRFLVSQLLHERGIESVMVQLHTAPTCPRHRRIKQGNRSVSRFLLERFARIEINQFDAVRVGVGSPQVGRLHISVHYAVLVEMIQCACCSTKRDNETTVVHAAPTQGRPQQFQNDRWKKVYVTPCNTMLCTDVRHLPSLALLPGNYVSPEQTASQPS